MIVEQNGDLVKRCARCKSYLDINKFNRDKGSSDGYSYYCKECRREYAKIYRVPKGNRREILLQRKIMKLRNKAMKMLGKEDFELLERTVMKDNEVDILDLEEYLQ